MSSKPEYLNISKHFRRLLEIEGALVEIGPVFEQYKTRVLTTADESARTNLTVEDIDALRIPGFFAYHLAQEGVALLNMIAASGAILQMDPDALDAGEITTIKTMLGHLDDVETLLRQTLHEMEPYQTMDANQAVAMLAARMAGK